MLLTLLVLAALSKTLVDAARVRANRVDMDRASEELHALTAMRADLQASLEVLQPAPGGSSARVQLRRVDPGLSFTDRISVLRDANDPFEPLEQIQVHYEVTDEVLRRTVTPAGQPARLEPLLSCTSLSASREDGMLTLELLFSYSRVQKSRRYKVELR